jgi:hypothetical protein
MQTTDRLPVSAKHTYINNNQALSRKINQERSRRAQAKFIAAAANFRRVLQRVRSPHYRYMSVIDAQDTYDVPFELPMFSTGKFVAIYPFFLAGVMDW